MSAKAGLASWKKPSGHDLILRAHAPLRLQLACHGLLRENLVARKTTDAASTTADGAFGGSGDAASVTPDASSIAHSVWIVELLRGQEIQTGKR